MRFDRTAPAGFLSVVMGAGVIPKTGAKGGGMPELPFKPFGSAPQDAEIMRRQLDELFSVAPQGSVVQDPARRGQLERAAFTVTEITAIIAAVGRVVPGLPGRLIASLLAGFEKSPGTGKVNPTQAAGANFLPSPLGYLDPKSVGLPPNFYLPSGATNYLPREIDRVGLGLPQQRAEDEAARIAAMNSAARSRALAAQRAVASEDEETLRSIIEGPGTLSRGARIFAATPAGAEDIQLAARRELLSRAVGVPVDLLDSTGAVNNALAQLRRQREATIAQLLAAGAALDAEQRRIAAELSATAPTAGGPNNPFATAAPNASIQTESVQPVNDAALRNQASARGIRRDLVSERADP